MADFQRTFHPNTQLIGNPAFANMVQSLVEGYQASQVPRNEALSQQKSQQQINADAFKNALEEKYGEKGRVADLAYKNAQTAEANERAEFGNIGANTPAGQALSYSKVVKKFGPDSPEAIMQKDIYDSQVAAKQSTTDRNKALTSSQSFRSLPAGEKNRIVSYAAGMGFDPAQASKLLNQGKNLQDLANIKGVNLEGVEPVYPLSNQTISAAKNRGAFATEIEYLDKNINNALKGIGHKVLGYSPTQIWGSIKNDNPDKQGQILAARALAPEMAALRLKAAGGNVGIEAIRELQHSALANLNVVEAAVSPEAREAMNKYITEWITGASQIYNTAINKSAQLGRQPSNDVDNRGAIETSLDADSDPLGLR